MIVEERRPTRKFKRRGNKRFPYRKNRSSMFTLETVDETLQKITGNSSGKLNKNRYKTAPFEVNR